MPGTEDQPEGDPFRRLQEVEATAQVGSWSWDISANLVTWSDELYRLYGLAPGSVEITYEKYMQLLPADERDGVATIIGSCLESATAVVFGHRVVLPDGEIRWHHCRAQSMFANGRAVRMYGTAQDITERTRNEQALRDNLERTRQLAEENTALRAEIEAQLAEVRASRSRIVEAADAARRRLERDLHDGAQQRLTTLGLMLRSVESRLGSDADPDLRRELLGAIDELREGLAELRALARGLHPAILTDEGLVPALRALVARAPLPVELAVGPLGLLRSQVEAAAYFVVSEALTNVVKHADASAANVTVERHNDSLAVEVTDDGYGGASFDAGGGLRGLSDRVEALDGRLELQASASGGTRLRVELPCG